MTPAPCGLLRAAALSLALVTGPAVTAYADERPHARDDFVAHATGPGSVEPFPTAELATGAPPRIAYAFATAPGAGDGGWELARPDGSSLPLPGPAWSVWAPIGGGAIGMAGTDAGPELQRVTSTGHVRSQMVQHFGLAVTPDGKVVGWLGDRGRPHLVGADSVDVRLPRLPLGTALASVQGLDTCQEGVPGGWCAVYVNGRRHAFTASPSGVETPVRQVEQVSDVSVRGRVAGLMTRDAPGSTPCWGVLRADGRRAFLACGLYLGSFSPDGRRVLAEGSQDQWSSVRRFQVLGQDGNVVRAWTFDAGRCRTLTQLTWEDNHHLLGVLVAHRRWGIVRIGTDGTVEYAGQTVAATGSPTPYSLPLR